MTHISVNSWIKRFKTEENSGLETRLGFSRKPIMNCSDEKVVQTIHRAEQAKPKESQGSVTPSIGRRGERKYVQGFLLAFGRDIDV